MTMVGHVLDTAPEDWPEAVTNDFLRLFCGDWVGGGIARAVYVNHADTSYVFKVELTARTFQNVTEWKTWEEVRETKWAKWFAPCQWISQNGHVLVQRRTRPLDKTPRRLPTFFTDLHLRNFGEIDGQVVCHDYGLNLLMSEGLANARMEKAEFWD